MAPRLTRISGLAALALPLAIAACAPKAVEAPPIATITVPLPQNVPLEPPPPPPPTLIGQSRGEDLWHLRSGLNVAVLMCQGPENLAMVTNYNSLLNGQRALLASAAQMEVDLYKAKGGRRWQDAYDDHMTKVYNAYAGTLTRDAFCTKARDILVEAAATTTAEDFNDHATAMLWELNKAAGLPDPDGALARAATTGTVTPVPIAAPAVPSSPPPAMLGSSR